MKGLLLKDYYMTVKYCRMLILMVLIFAAVSAVSNSIFLISYPFIIAGVLPVSLYAYDEKSGWCSYADAMPYSRAQQVSAKYISALVFICLVMLICTVGKAITGDSFIEDFSLLVMLCGTGLLSAAFLLPFVLKFGSEKGRWAYYAVIIIACVIAAAVFDTGSAVALELTGTAAACILAGCVLLFGLSWLLSIKIYEKRAL